MFSDSKTNSTFWSRFVCRFQEWGSSIRVQKYAKIILRENFHFGFDVLAALGRQYVLNKIEKQWGFNEYLARLVTLFWYSELGNGTNPYHNITSGYRHQKAI